MLRLPTASPPPHTTKPPPHTQPETCFFSPPVHQKKSRYNHVSHEAVEKKSQTTVGKLRLLPIKSTFTPTSPNKTPPSLKKWHTRSTHHQKDTTTQRKQPPPIFLNIHHKYGSRSGSKSGSINFNHKPPLRNQH